MNQKRTTKKESSSYEIFDTESGEGVVSGLTDAVNEAVEITTEGVHE